MDLWLFALGVVYEDLDERSTAAMCWTVGRSLSLIGLLGEKVAEWQPRIRLAP